MTGSPRLALLLAGAGRLRLLAWPLAVAVLLGATGASVAGLYDDAASRRAYAASLAAADILTAIGGASGGLGQLGGIIANEMASMAIPLLALAGLLLAIAATRGEEDAGRTELLTARPLGRLAPLTAGAATVTGSLVVLAALCLGVLAILGVPPVGAEAGTRGPADGGALVYVLSLLAYGLLFAGVGFVSAELARDAHTARAMALAVFAASYLVRAGVNGSGRGVAAGGEEIGLSWITPVGWLDAVAPFGAMRWAPLVALAGAAGLLMALAMVLRSRRDLGSGLIASRPGRTAARPSLGTPLGLAWRLARSSVLGWGIAALAFAVLMGSQLPAWIGALRASEAMIEAMGMQADASTITRMTLSLCAMLGAVAGISILGGLTSEERSEQLSLLLSRPVPRWRIWGAWTAVAIASGVGITAVSGAAYAASGRLALAGDEHLDAFSIPDAALATAVQLVPVALLIALATLRAGWSGRPLWPTWALIGVLAALLLVGPSLDLPDVVLTLAPFSAEGAVPVDDPVPAAIVAELALAAVACTAGGLRCTRRDLR